MKHKVDSWETVHHLHLPADAVMLGPMSESYGVSQTSHLPMLYLLPSALS